jgi:phosphate transport system substrate-binding protein
MPSDFRVSITNSPGTNAYPISSFTWLLIPGEGNDRAKQRELSAFLKWMITDGQTMTRELGYAPLPRNVIFKLSKNIEQIR